MTTMTHLLPPAQWPCPPWLPLPAGVEVGTSYGCLAGLTHWPHFPHAAPGPCALQPIPFLFCLCLRPVACLTPAAATVGGSKPQDQTIFLMLMLAPSSMHFSSYLGPLESVTSVSVSLPVTDSGLKDDGMRWRSSVHVYARFYVIHLVPMPCSAWWRVPVLFEKG